MHLNRVFNQLLGICSLESNSIQRRWSEKCARASIVPEHFSNAKVHVAFVKHYWKYFKAVSPFSFEWNVLKPEKRTALTDDHQTECLADFRFHAHLAFVGARITRLRWCDFQCPFIGSFWVREKKIKMCTLFCAKNLGKKHALTNLPSWCIAWNRWSDE